MLRRLGMFDLMIYEKLVYVTVLQLENEWLVNLPHINYYKIKRSVQVRLTVKSKHIYSTIFCNISTTCIYPQILLISEKWRHEKSSSSRKCDRQLYFLL